MATSPNYGWLEPDNTDLVKNGALAIRTLGNAIDTTMATMIPKSTYTAKGSIAAASAASTPANLPVGANDLFLTAASGETTGLKYTGGWTDYTPTFTNFTLGNGTITHARYCQMGKIMHVRVWVTLGSTSTMGSYPTVSIPKNAAYYGYFSGTATLTDAGTAYYLSNVAVNQTNAGFGVTLTNGTYAKQSAVTSGEPFTWGTNDFFALDFYYEVA